jgi:hypothetical protein
LFASLAPEQRPIAERLAAGGIPAVRRAIAEERERARSEGRPEVSGEAILALAEQIAPSVKQAIWLDRAEAAVAQLEQISLRDLRTTVAAAAPRDETARELDRKLREELERRIKKLRANWEGQITHALDESRILQALRFSAQPPEPTARFPATLVERLATSAGAAMTTSTPIERWLALLDAAVGSPIRRQIHPAGLPEDASGEIVRKARLAAGSVPALAPMIGLSMPPPPKPIRSTRPPRPPRPPIRAPRRATPPSATAVLASPGTTEDFALAEAPPESPRGASTDQFVPEAGIDDAVAQEAVDEAQPESSADAATHEQGGTQEQGAAEDVPEAPQPAQAEAPDDAAVKDAATADEDRLELAPADEAVAEAPAGEQVVVEEASADDAAPEQSPDDPEQSPEDPEQSPEDPAAETPTPLEMPSPSSED